MVVELWGKVLARHLRFEPYIDQNDPILPLRGYMEQVQDFVNCVAIHSRHSGQKKDNPLPRTSLYVRPDHNFTHMVLSFENVTDGIVGAPASKIVGSWILIWGSKRNWVLWRFSRSMLNEDKLRKVLPVSGLGEPLHFYPEVGSTNDIAIDLANQGASHGTLVLAEAQTAGRGQRGRKWRTVPGGGLAMSVILKPASFTGEDWMK